MKKKFNLKYYADLLILAINKDYKFISYGEVENNDSKFIILRHDIDADLSAAYEMAKIENNLNIKTTYFLFFHSPLYNLFSRSNIDIVKSIIDLGHSVGLHFDETIYPDSKIQEAINFEIDFLQRIFDIDINTVSFHQPSERIINNTIRIKQINTYDNIFFKEIKYFSDTNMKWKEVSPFEAIDKSLYKKIQLLIHPLWWIGNGCAEEKWNNAIIRNFEREQNQLLLTERAYTKKQKIELL